MSKPPISGAPNQPDRVSPATAGRRAGPLLLSLLSVLLLANAARARADERAPANHRPRIVLAGDSTVNTNTGWGPGFARCLTNAECINLARNGRSSKSFIAEGRWDECLKLRPDYVLIQFGHNDQPGHGPERETDRDTTYRQFMNRYVDDARAAGIKPVLITPLSRREWGDDGRIHSTLESWAEVVRQIAREKHVPLIDLQTRSVASYEKLGRAMVNEWSPLKNVATTNADHTVTTNSVVDGTHLNARGGAVIGPIVAEELARAVPELAPHIHVEPAAAGGERTVPAENRR